MRTFPHSAAFALLLSTLAEFCSPLQAQTYDFVTVAGIGPSNSGFVDGIGTNAAFYQPLSVAVDASGNIYVADTKNNSIRMITPAGIVKTLAGGGPSAPGYIDSTGLNARFNGPGGIAVDAAGNIYVADTSNNVVRKITPAGLVSTIAGGGPSAPGFVDGVAGTARFEFPTGVTVDSAGNVFVADNFNCAIRKITPAGAVTTLAGNGAGSQGFADGTGSAAKFNKPFSLAVDASGNVYVADSGNSAIRKVTSAGVVTTLAGGIPPGFSDGTGSAARFDFMFGIAIGGSGNLYVGDTQNDAIRMVTPAGVVTTVAGDGQNSQGFVNGVNDAGNTIRFYNPSGIALDHAGNLYVADEDNNAIREGILLSTATIATQPVSQTVAGGTSVTFTVTAGGSAPFSFQWEKNGAAISGATSDFLTLTGVQAGDAAKYTVLVSDSVGAIMSAPATLTISGSSALARLINVSTRGYVGIGGQTLIGGFVVSGAASETMLLRGDGPTLAAFGVSGSLASPQLVLFDSAGKVIATNTGWGNSPVDGPSTVHATIRQATSVDFAAVGAFGLSSGSADCAMVATLPPGNYTIQVAGVGNTTGIGLVEAYEDP